RPNVGKSTLFNRIAGERIAIVEDLPGTTRDRLYTDADWTGASFTLVDTGGIELMQGDNNARRGSAPLSVSSADFRREIREQAQIAIDEADVIVFLVDAKEGVTAGDQDVADVLRRSKKPVLLAANKADNLTRSMAAVEFYELGLGDPHDISALHGLGVGDLLDLVVESFPTAEDEEEDDTLKIAIIGRPNVGKSSLLNALLGQERAIVSEIPGTTRDAIDMQLTWEGEPVVLIDTAGIRRRGRVEQGVEKYSVMRALRAIQRSDVVALVIDASQGLTAQDAHVASYALDEWKGIMLVVNKWDLVEKDSNTMNEFTRQLQADLKFIDYVPMLFISALTRQRVQKVIPLAQHIQAERHLRIPTSALNKLVQDATVKHKASSKTGRQLRFYYASQVEVAPPTFMFFVNDVELVHFTYRRYLENQIRLAHPFEGTPIKLLFRNRAEREK
ncbi:MAG TPA: ribosome biogenesis GTPase Der, partial [Anaerolineae bacterium]|nr:ribosome biogenesis GTPase Der [Anaerolineae bacterium]